MPDESATPQTSTAATQRPAVRPGSWILGLLIALLVGGALNFVAGMIAIGAKYGVLGFLIGLVPGAIFVLPSLFVIRRDSFGGIAGGLCVGGCIIALIGGACAASMVGTTFH